MRGPVRVTAQVLFGRRHVAPVVAAFLDHAAAALRKLPAIRTYTAPDERPDFC